MQGARGTRFSAVLPTRWSWLALVASPSSYLLFIAIVVTMAAKAHVVRGLEEISFWPGSWIAASAPDVAVFTGLAAVMSFVEARWRPARWLTPPIAFFVMLLAICSAAQLWITGEQLTAQVMVLGLERFGDVTAMARASVHVGPAAVIAIAALIAAPLVAHRALRRSGQQDVGTRERARAAGILAVFAGLLGVVAPVPEQLAGLYRNAVAHTLWGLASGDRSWNGGIGLFAGYEPHDLVDADTLAKLRAGPHPNVVVIVLESTRRDATGLDAAHSHARTPHLVELAARGLEMTHGRAVIPHTTKSLWSMMCGRLPILQPKLYETRPTGDVQCIPDILSAAGWRTGFLQSAVGKFEDRPRLVRGLGFQELVAAEQYTKEIGGYLSTDDEALVGQLAQWLDKKPGPFMVMMLTSSTHHPYMLTPSSEAYAKAESLPTSTDRDRYDRQIEAEDRMVGGVLDLLRERGVLDHTIVVVLGDHGEGFGEKAARQHALNYYEEGLRVPWVITGPGISSQRVDVNTSVLDLAPTLLDLLGVQPTEAASASTPARSVLHLSTDRVLPFSCFFDKTCFGFVQGSTKVIRMRETDRSFYFDLASDPEEHDPKQLTPALQTLLEEVAHTVDRHRTNSKPVLREAMPDYPPWNCARNQPCGIKAP
ncbi:MAG TPA: sulfatase-like hydrolase/transferase [Kofleriaceae bacterium]|nr:sulfatase-like hydrolase/transferase [Kofleriaceae bacterium]